MAKTLLAWCFSAGLAAEVVESPPSAPVRCQVVPGVTVRDFNQLYAELKRFQARLEVRLSSRTPDHVDHESFRQIVDRGDEFLPLIVTTLLAGDFFMNLAMQEITGVDIRGEYPGTEAIGEQSVSKLWIRWWRESGLEWCEKVATGSDG